MLEKEAFFVQWRFIAPLFISEGFYPARGKTL